MYKYQYTEKKTMCNFYVQSEKVKKTKSKLEKKPKASKEIYQIESF